MDNNQPVLYDPATGTRTPLDLTQFRPLSKGEVICEGDIWRVQPSLWQTAQK